MDQKRIFKFCKDLGCCDVCCLRYMGIRSYYAYENAKLFCQKFTDQPPNAEDDIQSNPSELSEIEVFSSKSNQTVTKDPDIPMKDGPTENVTNEDPPNIDDDEPTNGTSDGEDDRINNRLPPSKRRKLDICVSCLGILQEDGWPEYNAAVKEVLDKKQYDSNTFGCGISSPIVIMLRERVLCLKVKDAFPELDERTIITLKDAWKWTYAPQLARFIGMVLDSGTVSPLLIVLHIEYPDDMQELEILKSLSPKLFQSRSRQRKRFTVEFTRRSVDDALDGATLPALTALGWGAPPAAGRRASCVSVTCTRTPIYLGGRYIKLSRELPQTPWVLLGTRMMESSVQEIIFEPLAKVCGMSKADADHRLKFMSSGREDVDVRCLGDGRPFAIEITDPRRELTEEELKQICETVSAGGQVVVKKLVPVTKEDLVKLKSGEENKTKSYEALCIKLGHSTGSGSTNGDAAVTVTDEDIANINSYRNTAAGAPERVVLVQKTPIRVLHRRPLLSRTKYVVELTAYKVIDHPQLLVVHITTSAGAYVKEFVHGELRRCAPSLAAAARAPLDILALDVTAVQLHWPDK